MSEKGVKGNAMIAINELGGIVFTNPVGVGWVGKFKSMTAGEATIVGARRQAFGLIKGSSDLIGWMRVKITPEMVGKTVAIFLAVETKDNYGKPTAEQLHFINMVRADGGMAGIVKGNGDIVRIVEEWNERTKKD
jgi:hypothetical protein